jgi:hypothetical protein
MDNLKIGIIIYLQPHELDDFHRLAISLNKQSKHINTNNFHFVIRMDETYLTEPSSFPQERLSSILPLLQWANTVELVTDETIRGTVSLKRECIKLPFTHYIWLDSDIVLPDEYLYYMEVTAQSFQTSEQSDWIVTPQTVRLWDETWDCLVNEKFIDKPLNYCRNGHNPHHDAGVYGDVTLQQIKNTIPNQPQLKFGAGWGTLLHRSVLDKVGIPEEFGHYGPEDTFIMWASTFIRIKQYALNNVVVCEDYTYRKNDYYKTILNWTTHKEEYRQKSEQLFGQAYKKLKEKYEN